MCIWRYDLTRGGIRLPKLSPGNTNYTSKTDLICRLRIGKDGVFITTTIVRTSSRTSRTHRHAYVRHIILYIYLMPVRLNIYSSACL